MSRDLEAWQLNRRNLFLMVCKYTHQKINGQYFFLFKINELRVLFKVATVFIYSLILDSRFKTQQEF
jgi:hypothetical protein